MKIADTSILLLFLGFTLNAQQIDWKEYPGETFVYEIGNREAENLLRSDAGDSLMLQMLHTPVASFRDRWDGKPEKGHFIFADIHKNRIYYKYEPVMPFQVFLFGEYGHLTLQVIDAGGNVRRDARVRMKGLPPLFDIQIHFDRASNTYRTNNPSGKEDRLLAVELDGFTAMFNLSGHFANPWFHSGERADGRPGFYSYMVTDKNRFKPGETVRFKSYALSGRRRPLKENLTLSVNGKKVKEIQPYHPGGYAGDIFLHDSLELKADRKHNLRLSDRKGRIVAHTDFSYEDYELHDSRVETKLAFASHYRPDTNRLEILATDANGFLLQDAKAEVLIRRDKVSASFTDLFLLPDTLMHTTIDLDNTAPATVAIPPSLFGESNCTYTVRVKVHTHDNQLPVSSRSASFYTSRYSILYSLRNDTVCFDFEESGRKKPVKAKLSYDDSPEDREITLPHEEPFRQSVDRYHIRVEEPLYSRTVHASSFGSQLDLQGGIAADSFNICLVNPLRLDVSWYIYRGSRLIERGAGKDFDFKYPGTDLGVAHYVELFYVLGGHEAVFRRTFTPKTGLLDVDIDLPERVYPGQTYDATVTVKDHMRTPVEGVDLTAFAFNSQLNRFVPDLSSYGPPPQYREPRTRYSIRAVNPSELNIPLDYVHWKTKAGLDTLMYYQYTFPLGKLFRHEIETPDSTTEFAPFAMKNGESVHVYVIELNDEPVYFSWTEQPKRYSFPVPDNAALQKVSMRLHDRVVILDSLRFAPGKKTLLSIDIDSLPPEKARQMMIPPGSFTAWEQSAYSNFISRIPVSENEDFTCLRDASQGVVYPVFHRSLQPSKTSVLTGPVPGGKRTVQYCDGIIYKHEGGFRYEYDGNAVYKYPEQMCPDNLAFSSATDFNNLNDFALTPAVFNRLIEQRRTDNWQPSGIHIIQDGLDINFKTSTHPDSTGVSGLLFRDIYTDSLIFPNEVAYGTRKYNPVPASTYDVILLYNSGRYVRFDSVPFRRQHFIEADMTARPLREADSLSREWLALMARPPYAYREQPFGYYSRPPVLRQLTHANAVTGVIRDSAGDPLPGATVMVKGANHGAVSDLDGHFQIGIDAAEAVLVFSYIGFNVQEVRVRKGSTVDIVMQENQDLLDEVIVIAFGTQKKASRIGSAPTASAGNRRKAVPEEKAEEPDRRQAKREAKDADGGQPEEPEEPETEEAEREAEARLYGELLQLHGLRSNFSDAGFWEPRLVTDKKGEAQFTVLFPDNITQWNAVVYAMNRQLKTGTARKYIKSYKPLMAELKNPSFLVAGDSAYYAGSIRNYTYGKPEISGQVTFAVGSDTVMREDIRFASSRRDQMPVCPVTADSLTTTYMFRRDDGYTDGERRTVPVIRQGTEVAEGTLDFLRNGDRKELAAAPGEELHLIIAAKQLDIYIDAIHYLQGYQYACNEQLASKLIGLLNYRLYAQYAGETFKYDKYIHDIIKRLTENRNENRLWSWWGRSSATSLWISAHVIRALEMAREAGYPVNMDLKKIEQDYTDTKPYRPASLADLDVVSALSEAGAEQRYDEIIPFFRKEIEWQEQVADSIAHMKKSVNRPSFLTQRMQLLALRQQHRIGYSPDSLMPYLKKDALGAVYCDDGKIPSSLYNDHMISTLIAYRIVRNDPALHHLKEPMQMYILGTKRNYWNTYRASSAVMTILPDLIAGSATKETPASVLLSGKENGQLTEFPYETVLLPGEQLTVEKQQGMPLIFSAYRTKYVTGKNTGDAFEVKTILSHGDTLTAGVPVTLTVEVEVKQKNAEHVMIEVPVPAGCSYPSKRPHHYGRYGPETYRESFKEKTVIFCESLSQGSYTFDIDLLPRYTGRYILNPAKVEMMYFPVINSNNDLRKVEIG
ncbi:MAG: carboxypeptidase-like regulatory domain-containing protein, partial [Tannerella sp.]|nr:carboxypeptidase-like regulatory domain-containing protein [Tannerella sp.]